MVREWRSGGGDISLYYGGRQRAGDDPLSVRVDDAEITRAGRRDGECSAPQLCARGDRGCTDRRVREAGAVAVFPKGKSAAFAVARAIRDALPGGPGGPPGPTSPPPSRETWEDQIREDTSRRGRRPVIARAHPRLVLALGSCRGANVHELSVDLGAECARRDSNPHAVRHSILSATCLPFHHSRQRRNCSQAASDWSSDEPATGSRRRSASLASASNQRERWDSGRPGRPT